MGAWGEQHPRARLTNAQAEALRQYYRELTRHPKIGRGKAGQISWSDVRALGLDTQTEIARRLGTSGRAISEAMRGLTYVSPDDRMSDR